MSDGNWLRSDEWWKKKNPNQALHFIHFYSFPFFYFKTSNQGYLIPFSSILFHSFSLFKYIPFHFINFHSPYNHSIPFLSLLIIQFHFLMNFQRSNLVLVLAGPSSEGPVYQKKKKKKVAKAHKELSVACKALFQEYPNPTLKIERWTLYTNTAW